MPAKIRNPSKGTASAPNPNPKKIQFRDEFTNKIEKNGETLLLKYDGTGHLTIDTRVKINSAGFFLGNSEQTETKMAPVTKETSADFVVIQTNKCDICENGAYMFGDSIPRIGYFEFKGISVYNVHLNRTLRRQIQDKIITSLMIQSAPLSQFLYIFKGNQVHKIRIGQNGRVQVDKVLEPYDLTSNSYDMNVFKLDDPDNDYTNYIKYFRLYKNRVSEFPAVRIAFAARSLRVS